MQAKGSSDADALRNRQYSADCTRLELNSKTFAIHFVWQESFLLYTYTIKPPAMRVVPRTALALDNKTSNVIISVGPKPHYI